LTGLGSYENDEQINSPETDLIIVSLGPYFDKVEGSDNSSATMRAKP
jgi:hypothetical protein